MRHSTIFVSVLMLLCSIAISATPPSEDELWALGKKKFGHDQFALLLLPNSGGPISDTMVSGWSALLGPSALVRHTVARLKDIHDRKLDVLVSGPAPTYDKNVLLGALSRLPASSLSGMKIYLVGIDAQNVQQATQRVGATLVK